uniref:Uncharacterized protein n=1 Tax=Oryzias latipes TaxID=8090 RepID=A0A3B3HK42_ORYLA
VTKSFQCIVACVAYEGDRRGTRDSPEQRERKRCNSDRSEDGYHSDGDYPDQDLRREPGEDKKGKTLMLGGLALYVTEEDIHFSIDQLEGPQLVDVRLMKKRTETSGHPRESGRHALQSP